jgi:hypothetical protein
MARMASPGPHAWGSFPVNGILAGGRSWRSITSASYGGLDYRQICRIALNCWSGGRPLRKAMGASKFLRPGAKTERIATSV